MRGRLAPIIKRILIALVLFTPVTAKACMGSGPGGFSSASIWKTTPSNIPKDSLVLKIRFTKAIKKRRGFSAKVLDGPNAMMNRNYRFKIETLTSCSTIGRYEGFVTVRKKLVRLTTDSGSIAYLSAISYNPSFLDWFVRIFSNQYWHYAGQIAEIKFPIAYETEATQKARKREENRS